MLALLRRHGQGLSGPDALRSQKGTASDGSSTRSDDHGIKEGATYAASRHLAEVSGAEESISDITEGCRLRPGVKGELDETR